MLIHKTRETLSQTELRYATVHLFLGLAFSFLHVSVALAADKSLHKMTVTLHPEKTSIHWTLSDPIHTVHGTFKLTRGVVSLNLDDGSAEGLIEVDAASGESGSAARDGRMHKNVLESDRYPVISFRPTRIIGEAMAASDEVVTAEGIFRIHGADHPLQLRINLHPRGNEITVQTHFVVPYVDWGMKDPSTFILRVDRMVDLDVETTVSRELIAVPAIKP
ncbi:YceI family protein [Edaphobacter flagellatus]|uniref:YceI family protein n=1 Tax=Edaphobacter flagellatus TaxID=1933044 RepID=UPI0021B3DC23|nr:YceI family protein [Edaphobacter flagellatus]